MLRLIIRRMTSTKKRRRNLKLRLNWEQQMPMRRGLNWKQMLRLKLRLKDSVSLLRKRSKDRDMKLSKRLSELDWKRRRNTSRKRRNARSKRRKKSSRDKKKLMSSKRGSELRLRRKE